MENQQQANGGSAGGRRPWAAYNVVEKGGKRYWNRVGSAFHNRDGFHHRFFHHRFHRFAFFGAPYYSYASYDDCWRRVWTRHGVQYVNVCGDYGY